MVPPPHVNRQRSFDDHVVLLGRFADRVSLLPPAAWDRIRERCASLSDPAFRALIQRAVIAAKPHEAFVPGLTDPSPRLRLIAAASRAVQFSIAFFYEFGSEFDPEIEATADALRRPWRSTGKPRTDMYIDAWRRIEAKLLPLEHSAPGVAAAVRAAGQAVLRHDRLNPETFADVYRFVEAEIPFAELESRS